MTDQDLGREALAWEYWAWMPGMRYWAVSNHGYAGCFGRVFEEGCCIGLIARHNHRKSMSDALADIRWHMGRGLSMAEAIVATMKACP